eukprot:6213542-Pleurochrysis_carterae.AAC.1
MGSQRIPLISLWVRGIVAGARASRISFLAVQERLPAARAAKNSGHFEFASKTPRAITGTSAPAE